MVRKGKTLTATDKGLKLVQVAPQELASPETTGKWERSLSRMAREEDPEKLRERSGQFMGSIRRFSAFLVEAAKAADAQVRFAAEEPRPKTVSYTHLDVYKRQAETCRRVVGLPILIIATVFVLYAFFGRYLPGFLAHRGFNLTRVVSHLVFTTEGIMGTPLGASATFIFLFVLFGAFLETTHVGQFFIDLANAVAGHRRGGPAKVAVLASALEGTVAGSSVANTVGSGSFTIPMMKNLGYRPEFAGAVEAAASTGGQIMPPVMGAAAFLMAESVGKMCIRDRYWSGRTGGPAPRSCAGNPPRRPGAPLRPGHPAGCPLRCVPPVLRPGI